MDPQSIKNQQDPNFSHRKILWVKKSLKDPTAALSYSLSVSILHLAMVVGIFFVDQANVKVTETMPMECQSEAKMLNDVMFMFFLSHVISFFATAYREIYSARTDLVGQVMRIIEVVCIPVLISSELRALELITVIIIR